MLLGRVAGVDWRVARVLLWRMGEFAQRRPSRSRFVRLLHHRAGVGARESGNLHDTGAGVYKWSSPGPQRPHGQISIKSAQEKETGLNCPSFSSCFYGYSMVPPTTWYVLESLLLMIHSLMLTCGSIPICLCMPFFMSFYSNLHITKVSNNNHFLLAWCPNVVWPLGAQLKPFSTSIHDLVDVELLFLLS